MYSCRRTDAAKQCRLTIKDSKDSSDNNLSIFFVTDKR